MAKGWSFGALIAALKGAAFLNVGTVANTVAAGNDSRIVNALQKGNNLADVANATTARNNLYAAYVNGDSNQTFYCSNIGYPTAAVNNERLNYMLTFKADLNGDSNVDFSCRNLSTGPIYAGGNLVVSWGGRGHRYQENGDIVEVAGSSSIFRQMENSTNLSSALGFCSRWTRTGARRDFGILSRNNDKWLDNGWVVIGAGARGNETIQNLVLLGGRLQIYRANGGWIDSAT